jgi:uncharacterized protein involved in exopolysaccharide biosynthesis
MNLMRLFQVFLSRWKIALLVFMIAATVGVLLAFYAPKTYTSTATIVVDAKIDPVAGMAQIAIFS